MTTRIDEHIYNNHSQSNERFSRQIDHALDRGKSIRLHQHAFQGECNNGCLTFVPASVEESPDDAS